MTLQLKGGRLLCMATGVDHIGDIWVHQGRIRHSPPEGVQAQVIDCAGQVVTPALVDLDARLCDPGFTWRESLSTGGEAALRGGFTTVVANPETDPVTDDPSFVREVIARAVLESRVEIRVAAALTKGLRGEELSELGLMAEAGASLFSNADRLVTDSLVLRNALLYARPFGLPVMLRAGDADLESVAVMNEGASSALAGLQGLPAAAEELGIARLIALARYSGTHVHVLGVSTKLALAQLKSALASGVPISGSTTALHCLLNDQEILASGYDTDTRLMPPLRSEEDRLALLEGLADGTLLGVSSAHAPLTRVDKELEFAYATPGALGLETALSSLLSCMPLEHALRALSAGPAKLLGLERSLRDGAPAELLVLDPQATWTVDPSTFASKSANTPLAGRQLSGVLSAVIHQGQRLHPA
ncbi:MAG: dihydroorotase [Cognaticolwellia sp.]|jgi:dihydroorotase